MGDESENEEISDLSNPDVGLRPSMSSFGAKVTTKYRAAGDIVNKARKRIHLAPLELV